MNKFKGKISQLTDVTEHTQVRNHSFPAKINAHSEQNKWVVLCFPDQSHHTINGPIKHALSKNCDWRQDKTNKSIVYFNISKNTWIKATVYSG